MAGAPRGGYHWFAAVAGAALLGASGAQAAPFVDVTYDLSDSTATSTISLVNVVTTVPPQGTLSGTQTIRYTGGSGSYTGTAGTGPTLATGAAELLTFNLYVQATPTVSIFTSTYSRITATTLATSDLHIEFLGLTTGAATGKRLASGTINPYGASGIFRVTGSQHCINLCGLANQPQSTVFPVHPYTFTAPLPVLTGAVGTSHTVKGTATGIRFILDPDLQSPLTNDSIVITGTTVIVGREISRTPVPEPATLPLAALGLAALGMCAAARRVVARR